MSLIGSSFRFEPMSPYSRARPGVEAAQHDRGDAVQRGAVRIGLAEQAQALQAGGDEAGERRRIGGWRQLAAALGLGESLAEDCLVAREDAAHADQRLAVAAGELGHAIADEADPPARAGAESVG